VVITSRRKRLARRAPGYASSLPETAKADERSRPHRSRVLGPDFSSLAAKDVGSHKAAIDPLLSKPRAHADACGTGELHTQSRSKRAGAAAELRGPGA
jgi:hypothetical protein